MKLLLQKRNIPLVISCLVFYLFIGTSYSTLKAQSDINKAYNEEKRVEQIQQRILEIYDKLVKSTVRVELGEAAGSAVLISEDGYILTAAHVVDAVGGKKAKVRLYDGTVYTAVCMGKENTSDYGLMKIEPTKKLIFAELGVASNLAKDEACLMFGHPASFEKERPAIGRIGFYKGITESDYLKTSCIMMPGDSGGPMFDLNGKVIGICSYISRGINQNYYASVDNVKKNWDKLVSGELFDNSKPAYGNSVIGATEKEKPFVLKGGKDTFVKVLSKKSSKTHEAIVAIESLVEGDSLKTQGTIFNKKGYIVAKSSQIGNSQIYCTLSNGNKLQAYLVGRDKVNDLVVLKVKTKEKLSSINLDLNKEVQTGQLLGTVSSQGDIAWSGILGLGARKIKAKETGFLGIEFEKEQDSVIIGNVIEGAAANRAGLLAGDKIIQFNLTSIGVRQDLLKALSKTEPDQEVTITVLRDSIEEDIDVVLDKRERKQQRAHYTADEVRTSKVKDGFPKAFTHDMPLQPNECGTPVINLQGEIIGINIARRNRTCSLAIPLEHIEKVVKTILEKAEING